MKKRVLSLIVALLMLLSLAACVGGGKTTTPPAQDEPANVPEAVPDEPAEATLPYPAEKVKIGFVTFDTAGEQFIAIQKYIAYLSEYLNIEMVYSESLDSAEGELAFIESCAAAGCQGIVGYYNIARNEAVQLTIDKGMYYYGVAEEDAVYDAFKDNPMYLGGIYAGNADYQSGYDIGKSVIDAGCTKIVYCAGGRDFGVKMFIDRAEGFYAAVEEAKAAGAEVEVVKDISGWPGTDAFSSEQAAAMDMDIDAIVSSFSCAMWIQPVMNADKMGTVKLAAIDTLIPDFIDLYYAGLMVALSYEPTATLALGIPMVVNAVTGNTIRDNNGQAPRFTADRLLVIGGPDYEAYCNFENGGGWMLNGLDILEMVKGYNPDADFDSIVALMNAISVDEINARRAAQN